MEARLNAVSREYPAKHSWIEYFHSVNRGVTLHGVGFLSRLELHPLEHLAWLIILVASIVCTVMTCNMALTRYQENPTVIFMERNFEEWNTSFPAAFICPTELVNPERLEVVAKRLCPGGDEAKLNRTRDFLRTLAYASYTNLDTLEPFLKDTWLPQENLGHLVQEIHQEFNASWVKGNNKSTKDGSLTQSDPLQIITEKGLCYSRNSLITGKMATKEGKDELKKKLSNILVASPLDSGKKEDFTGLGAPYKACWKPNSELPDLTSSFQMSGKPLMIYAILLDVNMFLEATSDVRALRITQRKCRFVDESDLAFTNVYSTSTCLIDCRRRKAVELCHCLPYFVPKGYSKECGITGMVCLAKNADKLKYLKLGECGCLPSCEFTSYLIEDSSSIDLEGGLGGLAEDLPASLRWQISKFPRTKYKRDIIFTFTDLLVSVGGTAGFFLGCSMLSILEVIYFFLVRMFFHFLNNRKPRKTTIESNAAETIYKRRLHK